MEYEDNSKIVFYLEGMNFLKLAEGTFKKSLKNPIIVSIAVAIGIIYAVVDLYNPIPGMIVGFGSLGGDWLGAAISVVQLITSIVFLGKAVVVVIISLLILAFFIGILMSGYMYLLKNLFAGQGNIKGSFKYGLKNNLGKSMKVSFYMVFLILLLIIFLVLALIPSMFTLWSSVNGSERLVPISILLTLITVFSIVFVLLYFSVYTFFWYPSITDGKSSFVKECKALADEVFWKLAGKMVLYFFSLIIIIGSVLAFKYAVPEGLERNNIYIVGVFLFETLCIGTLFLRFTSYSMGAYLNVKNRKKHN